MDGAVYLLIYVVYILCVPHLTVEVILSMVNAVVIHHYLSLLPPPPTYRPTPTIGGIHFSISLLSLLSSLYQPFLLSPSLQYLLSLLSCFLYAYHTPSPRPLYTFLSIQLVVYLLITPPPLSLLLLSLYYALLLRGFLTIPKSFTLAEMMVVNQGLIQLIYLTWFHPTLDSAILFFFTPGILLFIPFLLL